MKPTPCSCADQAGEQGCAEKSKPQVCCRLDCLEFPNFHGGQLLTDGDLNHLLEWSRDKFRLRRFTEGWGVVCGLSVGCVPEQGGRVVVAPGYAVDCCGNDVVLCEPVVLDLSCACDLPRDPCSSWDRGEDEEEPRHTWIDLYLYYQEQPTAPKILLKANPCFHEQHCVYSRTREGYRLAWKKVTRLQDPESPAYRSWLAEFRRQTDLYKAFKQAFPSPSAWQPEELRLWMLEQIKSRPPQRHCFLLETLQDLAKAAKADPPLSRDQYLAVLARVLFELSLDRRLAFSDRSCFSCSGEGVRLARLCLFPVTECGVTQCRVRYINDSVPFRREQTPNRLPTERPDQINLARYFGFHPDYAIPHLKKCGCPKVTIIDGPLPDQLNPRENYFQFRPLARTDEAVFLMVRDSFTGPIVYDAFTSQENPPPADSGEEVRLVNVFELEGKPVWTGGREVFAARELEAVFGLGETKKRILLENNISTFHALAEAEIRGYRSEDGKSLITEQDMERFVKIANLWREGSLIK